VLLVHPLHPVPPVTPAGAEPDGGGAPRQTLAQQPSVAALLLRRSDLPSPWDFVENRGQWPDEARFVARQPGARVQCGTESFAVGLVRAGADGIAQGQSLRLSWSRSAGARRVIGEQPQGRHNFVTGSDPSAWTWDAPSFARLRWPAVRPGVDLMLHERDGLLAYDLLLAPGASVDDLVLTWEGAEAIVRGSDDALELITPLGTVRQTPPRAWQVTAAGTRRPIACRVAPEDRGGFRFVLDDLEPDLATVIDPGLDWGTIFGGDEGGGPCFESGAEQVNAVAIDAARVITIGGSTQSFLLPTTPGAFAPAKVGCNDDAFVARLDPGEGNSLQLKWSTYLGTTQDAAVNALAVDDQGVVTVVGNFTGGTPFPTTPGAFDATPGFDAFVTRLDPAQTGAAQLVYSTLLGPDSKTDFANAVALDEGGAVIVGGSTTSHVFPTTPGAFAESFSGPANGNGSDGFVVRLDPSLTGAAQLTYSTYLGGTANPNFVDAADSVRVLQREASGTGGPPIVIVAGSSWSHDFPTTTGAFMQIFPSGVTTGVGFVSRLALAGGGAADLLYSTFLGGDGGESNISGLAVESPAHAVVAGYTVSPAFPVTPGAFDTTYAGPAGKYDVFISRLNLAGNGPGDLLYSTYLGGSDFDQPVSVSLVGPADVVVAGSTSSPDFPITPGAFQATKVGSGGGFAARLQMAGQGSGDLAYSTFYSQSNLGGVRIATADAQGRVVLAGSTLFTDSFVAASVTPDAFQLSPSGSSDAYLAMLETTGCEGGSISWYGAASAGSGNLAPSLWALGCPVPGKMLTLQVKNGMGGAHGALLLGVSGPAQIHALGATIWVAPPFGTVLIGLGGQIGAWGAGSLALPAVVPDIPGVVGTTINLQAVFIDPGAWWAKGYSMTNGLALTFGG
jgi:hypothetical protein